MVSFSTVSSMLQGFTSARQLILFKADEDAAETGGNWIVNKVSQCSQTVFFLESVDYLEVVIGERYLSRTVCLLIYLSPFAALFSQKMVSIAGAYQERQEDGLRASWLSVAEWIHRCVGTRLSDHVGSICQVATLITNLVLLRLGYRAYPLTSLAILGWGLLDRHHYLPQKMRRVYQAVAPWISGASCFVTPQSWFTRCIVAFEWGVKISEWLTVPRFNLPYAEAPLPPRLPFEQFQRICNPLNQRVSGVDLGVCRDHVRIAPFPVVISPAELMSKKKMSKRVECLYALCNGFAWEDEKNYASLELALERDSRWRRSEAYQNAEKEGGNKAAVRAFKIAYAKERFQGLIESVVEETIATGTPLDYGILKNYLAFIADGLPKADGVSQVQILIQLAVEGGDYCGPGIYFQLEMAATALLSGGVTGECSRLPLRQRILLTLQQDRLRIVQAMHVSISGPILKMQGGVEDIHSFNRTIRVIAEDFGLPDQGAQQDETAYVSYFDKLFLRWYYGMQHLEGYQPEDLWQGGWWGEGYTRKRIVDTVMSHIGSRLMPNEDVYAWAQEWIARSSAEEAQEDFLEKLMDGSSFEQHCQFRRPFIEAMLVDMGILSVS